MACDPNELLEDAKCYLSCFTGEMYEAAMIYLLCKIRDSETVECDPAVIASDPDFTCIMTCIPRGARAAVIVSLLCDIAAGGGGGGGECFVEAEGGEDIGNLLGIYTYNTTPGLPGVTSLTLKMDTTDQGADIEGCDDLVTLSFPNLTGITGGANFFIANNDALETFEMPLAVTMDLQINPSAALSTVDFSAFQTGTLIIRNTALTSISLPALVGSGVTLINLSTNAVLTTISIGASSLLNGFNLNSSGCALTAATVNSILAIGVANAGYTSGVLNLGGGTNAAPTGQGILDKATLLGRGVTVTTN